MKCVRCMHFIYEEMSEKVKSSLTSLLLMVCVAEYPIIFMYCQNVTETEISEIASLLLVFPAISLGIWALCILFLKTIYKSTLVAFVLVGIASNYMLIQKVFTYIGKNLKYWHVLPIVCFAVIHVIYFIVKKTKEENLENIIRIILLVLAGLLAINYFPAIPRIIEKAQQADDVQNTSDLADFQEGPNVYWMIFDECASFATIEQYYGYSDKSIYNFLVDSGFTISDTSRNESGNTVAVLTNCINLDYIVNSDMDATQMSEYRTDPLLTRILTEEGYTIKGIGDTEWLGIPSVNYGGGSGAQTVEGFGIRQLILQNTIIGPFVEYDGTQSAKLVIESLEYMKEASNITPGCSQFNIMYLNSPHQPFLFDENGDSVQAANYNNWDDDKYYLGQYIFIMKEIKAVVENILTNDPGCVIIIESDHGPRFKEEMPFEDKINILNAVYFMGEDISEIDGKSGVNTLRTILSRLFDCALEDVEVKDGE